MGGGAREERGQSFPFHPSGVMKGRAEEGGHWMDEKGNVKISLLHRKGFGVWVGAALLHLEAGAKLQ